MKNTNDNGLKIWALIAVLLVFFIGYVIGATSKQIASVEMSNISINSVPQDICNVSTIEPCGAMLSNCSDGELYQCVSNVRTVTVR